MSFEEIWSLNGELSTANKIDLSVYISQKSEWKKTDIFARLIEANHALATCDLVINNVYVHKWLPSNPRLRVDEYIAKEKYFDGIRYASHKAKQVTSVKLFYFNDYLESFTSGPSVPLSIYPDTSVEAKTFNTTWFPYHSAQRSGSAGVQYNEEAHELGHVLLQSGHDNSGNANIMANDSKKRILNFSKKQCDKIKRHPSIIKSFRSEISPLFSTYYQNYSNKFYMADWCSRNVLNLSRAIDKLFNLKAHKAYSVFVVHKKVGTPFYPLKARNSKNMAWRFHSFLIIDGWVLDLDFGETPKIVSVTQYLHEMFGNQVQELVFQLRDPLGEPIITYDQVADSFRWGNEISLLKSESLLQLYDQE